MSRTREILALLMMLVLVVSAAACGGGGASDSGGDTAGDSSGSDSSGSEQTAPTGTATVSGKIVFEGDPPTPRPLNMEGDPKCAAMHADAPAMNEMLVLGGNQELANAIVRISAGLPEGSHATPSDPVVIDQKGCKYEPRVVGVMAGQTLRILNSDGILHNVHALPNVNREFNLPMPATVTETDKVFNRAEDVFEVKCDVHPWMKAHVQVFDNPYFAVTGTDGSYEIGGLPAGTYTVEMWHEVFGTQTQEVTVADGETASADFTTQRPQ